MKAQEIISFLSDLKANNNREWFEANKPRYRELQAEFDDFTKEMISGITTFDPSVKGVEVKDCTYRIYRDVRFSPNKEPYKTYMGAYICPNGKKSGYSGYYFHFEPNHSILAVGLHCPEPKVIKSVRDEIFDNGDEFVKSMQIAKGFTLDESTKLQRTPKGFPQGSNYDDLLRLKDFTLIEPLDINRKDLREYFLGEFSKTVKFNEILNRAVKYAFEEL